MTRVEYDLLREQEAQLRLPAWGWLLDREQERLEAMDRDTLITLRTAKLPGRDWPQMDEWAWAQYLLSR